MTTPTITQTLTFEDYLAQYAGYEGGRTEWMGGYVEFYMGNNLLHQELLHVITALLRLFLHLNPLGRLVHEGIPMWRADTLPAREPDAMVLLNPHLDRLHDTFIEGPADVVIEVVSPESFKRDTQEKFKEYQSAGVTEYWLINPASKTFDVYHLNQRGVYERIGVDESGVLASRVLPLFRLPIAFLWQNPLPNEIAIVEMVQSMKD